MLDIFDEFATDEKKENEGVAVDLGGGASLLIARRDNVNYLRIVQEEADTFAVSSQGLSAEDYEKADKAILTKILAGTILLGWKNLSYKGKPLPYNVKNAVMLLGHKDFRRLVMEHASDIANYKAKLEDKDEKNSQRP
jgi:hypothetical protein